MQVCEECYGEDPRETPYEEEVKCLQEHTQYICGTCGRCICLERDTRGLQKWNYPVKTLPQAKSLLRTADYSEQTNCGVYEVTSIAGRIFFRIFVDDHGFEEYLRFNPVRRSTKVRAVFRRQGFRNYPHTQIRKLTPAEVERYLKEKEAELTGNDLPGLGRI